MGAARVQAVLASTRIPALSALKITDFTLARMPPSISKVEWVNQSARSGVAGEPAGVMPNAACFDVTFSYGAAD
jgi:hypothetical protein